MRESPTSQSDKGRSSDAAVDPILRASPIVVQAADEPRDLPLTTEQFLSVFREYHIAIWPAQVVTHLLGADAIGLAVRASSWTARIISLILAAFWGWMGAVYHLAFFRDINPAAVLFGGVFVLQGLLFLVLSARAPHFRCNPTCTAGLAGSSSRTRWPGIRRSERCSDTDTRTSRRSV